MEVVFSLWIKDPNQKRVSGPMVREMAKHLFAYFKEPDGSCSGECKKRGFQPTEGWFNKFKATLNIKIVRAERFPEEFVNLVADGRYRQNCTVLKENDKQNICF